MAISSSRNNFSTLSPSEKYSALMECYQFLKYSAKETLEWRKIPGHPEYEISSSSLIRHNKSYFGKRRMLVQTLRNNRYFYATLTNQSGKRVGYPVDKLMVMTFYEIPKDKIRNVIHKDGIKHNNQLINLTYVLW